MATPRKTPATAEAGKAAPGPGAAQKQQDAPKQKTATKQQDAPKQKTAPKQQRQKKAGDEAGWSAAELDAVRAQLDAEIAHLTAEITTIDHRLADLIQDSGDGAGDDQAESGSKAFEREHEQTLANIARDVIVQSRHALQRIADGSYGTCESCGRPIAKPRLQAFPRATLCVQCKQREEEHH